MFFCSISQGDIRFKRGVQEKEEARNKNKHSGHKEKKIGFKYFISKSLSVDRRVASLILLIFLHFFQLALFILKIVWNWHQWIMNYFHDMKEAIWKLLYLHAGEIWFTRWMQFLGNSSASGMLFLVGQLLPETKYLISTE